MCDAAAGVDAARHDDQALTHTDQCVQCVIVPAVMNEPDIDARRG
jgi:hypothetical protein